MKRVTVSGKTIEDAIAKAVVELQTTQEKVDYNVVEQPQKGLFGLFGSKPAVVDVFVLPDPVEKAHSFLQGTLDHLGIEATIEKEETDRALCFNLSANEGTGRIIGKRGQTLESLEFLTNLVANREADVYTRIELDTENYRQRRREVLENLALKLAKKAKMTRQKVSLEPMNAAERKMIHTTLQSYDGIETVSEGKGINRHIVILPKENKFSSSL
ncbi:RNA-binding cell elongation regulator Jag/EloR [Halalkalibacter hemicellulosilyticus]|uniref:RNA-binding protein KhpB n=1 Tax=Halalkalibacter hemicellulosilyticusJCM 9152 TaxID=1236971 RepID=W4QJM5_9BACI|nr:RNA-binding cell elongation regulator Jag/EloR [Halalkalibacter hemicellulosilyticus]GAE32291.1 RNA-binding protein Jag [Halalkalibacter hemicellulosilyticusJCM 9152]